MLVSQGHSVPENQHELCPMTALKITKTSWYTVVLVLRAGWTPSGLPFVSAVMERRGSGNFRVLTLFYVDHVALLVFSGEDFQRPL